MATDLSGSFGAGPVPAHRARPRRAWYRRVDWIAALFGFQVLCAFFFLAQMWSEVLGLRHTPLAWEYQELIQILASIGMITGVVASWLFLRASRLRLTQMGRQIDAASGRFQNHLHQMFAEWDLSPSEQDVAIYAMKGFSNAEIAEFRSTSASTAKSQMNAVYRKSGLANRQQLISCLVEEVLSGVTAGR